MEPLRGVSKDELEPTTSSAEVFRSHRPATPTQSLYKLHRSNVRRHWLWRIRNFASTYWLWESSACVLSLVLLGVICYQLKKIDSKSIYVWDWPWEPNAVLAFSVTIMKAAMMIPVASSLSQLKWLWFRNVNRLEALEHFDEASRGVLGSLRLMFELRVRHLACVGALITIFALSIDTLAQNAVKVASVDDFTETGYVYATNVYNSTTSYKRRQNTLPPRGVLSSINYAITSSGDLGDLRDTLWHCATGNCRYPAYQSLAIGVQCHQRNLHTERSIAKFTLEGDPDITLDLNQSLINSTTAFDYPVTISSLTTGPLLAKWLILVNPSTIEPLPVGMECIFYWIINQYKSSVVDNVFKENITSTWTSYSDREADPHDITLTPPDCLLTNSTLLQIYPGMDPDICSSHIYKDPQASLQSYFRLPELGIIGSASNDTRSGDLETYFDFSNMFMQTLLTYIANRNETTITENIAIVADRLAWALSVSVRTSARYWNETDEYYGYYRGTTVWTPDQFYKIAWGYLVVPIVLVVFSTLFFAATVVLTRGDVKWKSSQLAIIFHGLCEEDLKHVGDVTDYADMREVGRDMRTRLVETWQGKRLMSKDLLADYD